MDLGGLFVWDSAKENAWSPALAQNPDHVFLFAEAKPVLAGLLRRGIDVARPVCLQTLATLARQNLPAQGDPLITLQSLMENLAASGQEKVARLECLVLRPFIAMESRGLPINLALFHDFMGQVEKQPELTGANSAKQLGHLLETDLFGGLAKDPHSPHRIQATFVPLGSSTGRVACHNPNLQNLPAMDSFRQCIRPGQGRVLVSADYAGCELRILAACSRDSEMLGVFDRDLDLHAETAKKMFKMPVSKTENLQLRSKAKAINFGLIYGMGPKALARDLEISQTEAERLFEQYFAAYPRVRGYLEALVETALQKGYAETVLGRKLYFDPEILAKPDAKQSLFRIARNMPVQGTGADIIKLAMVRLHERLVVGYKNAWLVNMIHDELLVECDKSDADAVAQIMKEEMEGAEQTLIPEVKPQVDVHIADYWRH